MLPYRPFSPIAFKELHQRHEIIFHVHIIIELIPIHIVIRSVTFTFLFGIYFQLSFRRPSPSVVPLRPLFLVSVSSLLRYRIVPVFLGIYVSWYIECSGRRYPPANTSTFYPVFVFLSCAETTLADAYQPPRSPFVTDFLYLIISSLLAVSFFPQTRPLSPSPTYHPRCLFPSDVNRNPHMSGYGCLVPTSIRRSIGSTTYHRPIMPIPNNHDHHSTSAVDNSLLTHNNRYRNWHPFSFPSFFVDSDQLAVTFDRGVGSSRRAWWDGTWGE